MYNKKNVALYLIMTIICFLIPLPIRAADSDYTIDNNVNGISAIIVARDSKYYLQYNVSYSAADIQEMCRRSGCTGFGVWLTRPSGSDIRLHVLAPDDMGLYTEDLNVTGEVELPNVGDYTLCTGYIIYNSVFGWLYRVGLTILNTSPDTTPPTAYIAKSTDAWTNQPIQITFRAEDESGIASITKDTIGGTVYASQANDSVIKNGVYKYTATDGKGNIAIKTIEITNIDTVKPVLSGVVE